MAGRQATANGAGTRDCELADRGAVHWSLPVPQLLVRLTETATITCTHRAQNRQPALGTCPGTMGTVRAVARGAAGSRPRLACDESLSWADGGAGPASTTGPPSSPAPA